MPIFKRKKRTEADQQLNATVKPETNQDGNHPKVPPIDYTNRQTEKVVPAKPEPQPSSHWQDTEAQLHEIDHQRDQLADDLREELLSARGLAKYQLRQLNRPTAQAETAPVDDQQAAALTKQIATLNQKLNHWYGTDKMANEIYFDADRPYLLLNNGLVRKPNPQQQKSLQRLKKLFQDKTIRPTQVTIDYDDLLQPTWARYQKEDLVQPQTKLMNLFQDLQSRTKQEGRKANQLVFAPGFKVETTDQGKKVYDPDGKLTMIIDYRHNGKLFTVRHFLNETLLSRDLFDHEGVISATQYYAADQSQKVVRENFYRPDGTLAIVKSYLKDEPYIQVLGPSNVLMAVFDSDLELITWWFTHRVLQPNSVVIVSIDSVLYQSLLETQDQGIEVIPLVSALDLASPQLQDLAQHCNGIESILVADQSIKQYLEQHTQIDLDITVIPQLKNSADTAESD